MTSTTAVEVTAVSLPEKSKIQKRSITGIDSVASRVALGTRRAPHWRPVKNGAHIGYRKMTPGADTGVWLARVWIGDKYAQASLGDFGDLSSDERYDAAVAKARVFFEHHAAGGSTEKITVRAAGQAYVAKKLAEEGEQAAKYAEAAIRRTIYEDQKIADVLLSKLTEAQCMSWRQRLLERMRNGKR